MKVKIFGKPTCPVCKEMLKKFHIFLPKWGVGDKVEVLYYDLDTPDGLTEAAYYNALDVPVIIIEDEEKEVARWSGRAITSSEFKPYFKVLELR